MEKLISLIFPPRFNRLRYHGVFAPRAKLREEITPKHEEEPSCGHDTDHKDQEQHVNQSRRIEWARLLARPDFDIFEHKNGKIGLFFDLTS